MLYFFPFKTLQTRTVLGSFKQDKIKEFLLYLGNLKITETSHCFGQLAALNSSPGTLHVSAMYSSVLSSLLNTSYLKGWRTVVSERKNWSLLCILENLVWQENISRRRVLYKRLMMSQNFKYSFSVAKKVCTWFSYYFFVFEAIITAL